MSNLRTGTTLAAAAAALAFAALASASPAPAGSSGAALGANDIVHCYGVVLEDAPPQVNALKSRFLEDFAGFGYRDDNEIFERIQHSLTTIPEMEWVDFSKGLGTDREVYGADGAITGAVSDETGIRGAYFHWQELMNRDVRPCVVR